MDKTAIKTEERSFNAGMGDIVTASEPEDVLVSLGLGSCVAVVLYDQKKNRAAMAHVMLPDSQSRKGSLSAKPGKFADTALSNLIKEMEKMGSRKKDLKAKIAGGARMFSFSSSSKMNIGDINVEKVTVLLEEHDIPLEGSDTGGNKGRSVKFYTGSSVFAVKTIGKEYIHI